MQRKLMPDALGTLLDPPRHGVRLAHGTPHIRRNRDVDQRGIPSRPCVRREADHLVFEVPQHGKKRMFPLGKGRYFFKDGAQTEAQVITRADRSTLLVLEAAGGELRLIRVAD